MSSENRTLDYRPLLEMATPNFYRRNLFRVLGLRVGASPSDVRRQQQRLAMQRKLGIPASDPSSGTLALDPPPTDEELSMALDHLSDPETCLLHEVFWFWPTNGDCSVARGLKALDQGDISLAIQEWEQERQTNESGNSSIATHNLAVLRHLIADDHESQPMIKGLSKRDQKQLPKFWSQAISDWKAILEDESFWDLLKQRTRELADQKLTTGVVHRLRRTLPRALLLINARYAHMAAERTETEQARRHMRIISEADFSDAAADAIREALHPLRKRIKAAVETARNRWASSPQHGHRHVRDMHDHAVPLLQTLDNMLDDDDAFRCGLHDLIADAMLDGQLAFGQKTNDWGTSIELLKLAQNLAVGESICSRLSENIEVLEKNAELANDWCAPGYWDLPTETIDTLETARLQTQGGNHDAAIRALVVLDPEIGVPLRRSLAFALSQRANQIAGQGFDNFNTPTSTLQRFLNVIDRKGSISVPNPQMESWMLPNCPCCNNKYYTSWVNGEFNGQQFWMCSSCSEKDNREKERMKGSLSSEIGRSLEYLLLAYEIDPKDPGIKEEVKTWKGIAKQFNVKPPKTKAIKERLNKVKWRGVRHTFDNTAIDAVCHFCGVRPADESCAIELFMCGDSVNVPQMFGNGIEYRFAEIAVPRCRICRDDHRELPSRKIQWERSRDGAADEAKFPELIAEKWEAEAEVSNAQTQVEQAEKAVSEAKAALAKSETIGEKCEKCRRILKDGLCRHHDSKLFVLGTFTRNSLIGLPALMFGLSVILMNTTDANVAMMKIDPRLVLGASILAAFVIYLFLKNNQWRKRSRVRTERKESLARKREETMAENHAILNTSQQNDADVQTALKAAQKIRDDVLSRLKDAQQQATSLFVEQNPIPELPPNTKPESEYKTFPRLTDLHARGWSFGEKPQGDGESPNTEPLDVRGLVTDLPEATNARKKTSSSGSKHGRDRIKEIAKEGGDKMIKCPICNTELKAKNLLRHYDRLHSGEDIPAAYEQAPVSAEEQQTERTSSSSNTPLKKGCTHDYFTGAPCLCSKCFGTRHEWESGICRRCGKRK